MLSRSPADLAVAATGQMTNASATSALTTRKRMSSQRLEPIAISVDRSEEHTSELQSLMRISYAVFCLKKKKKKNHNTNPREKRTRKQPTQHYNNQTITSTNS